MLDLTLLLSINWFQRAKRINWLINPQKGILEGVGRTDSSLRLIFIAREPSHQGQWNV